MINQNDSKPQITTTRTFNPKIHHNPLFDEAVASSDLKTLRSATYLIKYLSDSSNIALTQARLLSQKTRYLKDRPARNSKYKGHNHGLDYSIIDLKIDLELHIKTNNFELLTPIVIQLYRIING